MTNFFKVYDVQKPEDPDDVELYDKRGQATPYLLKGLETWLGENPGALTLERLHQALTYMGRQVGKSGYNNARVMLSQIKMMDPEQRQAIRDQLVLSGVVTLPVAADVRTLAFDRGSQEGDQTAMVHMYASYELLREELGDLQHDHPLAAAVQEELARQAQEELMRNGFGEEHRTVRMDVYPGS